MERFSSTVSRKTGSSGAFVLACFIVLVWGASGPIFHYSENWQLVINTGTTIITFLMVFLIQKAQNKDSMAIQLKLDELVAAHEFASNILVSVENMSESEMSVIKKYYAKLSQVARNEKQANLFPDDNDTSMMNNIKNAREEGIKDELNQLDD